MAWLYLLLASLAEVSFTTALRLSRGFRNLPAVAALAVSVVLSLVLLDAAQRRIPLGTAYAVWTGVGAVGTVAVGVVFFREPASLVRGLLVLGLVACVAGLKATARRRRTPRLSMAPLMRSRARRCLAPSFCFERARETRCVSSLRSSPAPQSFPPARLCGRLRKGTPTRTPMNSRRLTEAGMADAHHACSSPSTLLVIVSPGEGARLEPLRGDSRFPKIHSACENVAAIAAPQVGDKTGVTLAILQALGPADFALVELAGSPEGSGPILSAIAAACPRGVREEAPAPRGRRTPG